MTVPSFWESLLRRYFNKVGVGPDTNVLGEKKFGWISTYQENHHIRKGNQNASHLRRVRIGFPVSKSLRKVVILPKQRITVKRIKIYIRALLRWI